MTNFTVTETPSLKNRALNYGDGCFTTMFSNKGSIELVDWHVERLLRDAEILHILNDQVMISHDELRQLLVKVASEAYKNGVNNKTSEKQIIKLLLIRGDSERGYSPSINSRPVLVPSVQNYEQSQIETLNIGVAEIKLASQPLLSGAKHMNRLEQVLAKLELDKHSQLDDLVLTDTSENIIELTSSNLFYSIEGVWHTPCVEQSGVNGVMRQFILSFMQENNITCVVSKAPLDVLVHAEAAFSCNAVTKVIPIETIHLASSIKTLSIEPCRMLAKKILAEVSRDS